MRIPNFQSNHIKPRTPHCWWGLCHKDPQSLHLYIYIYVYIYSIYVILCYIHHVIPMMFQPLIHINYIYIYICILLHKHMHIHIYYIHIYYIHIYYIHIYYIHIYFIHIYYIHILYIYILFTYYRIYYLSILYYIYIILYMKYYIYIYIYPIVYSLHPHYITERRRHSALISFSALLRTAFPTGDRNGFAVPKWPGDREGIMRPVMAH